MEVKLSALLGNYDRLTNQLTDPANVMLLILQGRTEKAVREKRDPRGAAERIRGKTDHATTLTKPFYSRYTAMLQQVLSTPYFYFSYTHDLTHTRQRLDTLGSREFYQVKLHFKKN